jgi:hypothetical protein
LRAQNPVLSAISILSDKRDWTKPLRGREQCQRETVDRGVVPLVG